MLLQTVNNALYESILKRSNDNNSDLVDDSILSTLKSFCQSEIYSFFSDNLGNLKSFIFSIDIDHGELPNFLYKNTQKDIIQIIDEINQIFYFCRDKKFKIQNDLSCFSKNIVSCFNPNFLNFLGNPEKTKVLSRFLKFEKRWHTRGTKNKQVISKKNNPNISYIEAGSLDSIYHNSQYCKSILFELQNKKSYFEKISCCHLAAELDKSIERINETFKLERYGFQRVSISKLLYLIDKNFSFNNAQIIPIRNENQLSNCEAKRFIELCENFNFNGRRYPVFDHYAEIKLDDLSFSVLIGEIDTKSYFICYNF